METNLVVTLTGPDKVGLVEQVSKAVVDCGGNILASRMAHLGGAFAMIMYIEILSEKLETLKKSLDTFSQQKYTLTFSTTSQDDPEKYSGWIPYQVEVHGADHEGIIHHITAHFAKHSFNIERMETNSIKAPFSGIALFQMSAIILIPPEQLKTDWQAELKNAGHVQNVDVNIKPYTPQ